MKKINLFLMIVFLLTLSIVYSDCDSCQDVQQIGTCCDIVKLTSACAYVNVYYSNGSLYQNNIMDLFQPPLYYNYTLSFSKTGLYILDFCDGNTWAQINVVSNTSLDTLNLTLNKKFFTGNEQINISLIVNIISDIVNITNLKIYMPNGTLFLNGNIIPENPTDFSIAYDNEYLDNISTGLWNVQLTSYGLLNNYTKSEQFMTNPKGLSFPTCNVSNYTLLWSAEPYCEVNENCDIYLQTLNISNSTNVTIIFSLNGINYTASQTIYRDIQKVTLFSNFEEDDLIYAKSYYADGLNIFCSNSLSQTLKIRIPYYVTVNLYQTNWLNNSVPYNNNFDYIYLTYTNSSNRNIVSSTTSATINTLRLMNSGLKKFNEQALNLYISSSFTDNTPYFWARYTNGQARIKTYEKGTHNLYIVNSRANFGTQFPEFIKPIDERGLQYDNLLMSNIHLNQTSNTISLKINPITLNWLDIISKIGYTVLWILLFLIVQGIAFFIASKVGVPQLAMLLAIFTVPITIILIVMSWL